MKSYFVELPLPVGEGCPLYVCAVSVETEPRRHQAVELWLTSFESRGGYLSFEARFPNDKYPTVVAHAEAADVLGHLIEITTITDEDDYITGIQIYVLKK